MPLVRSGKIIGDAFVHVADDDPLTDGGAMLISAARFLGDAEALSRRVGGTGVVWPNNRDVDDLVPYLDRLAVVALVFPTFRGCCGNAIVFGANCAPPDRCCAISSYSCCAPDSTRSK